MRNLNRIIIAKKLAKPNTFFRSYHLKLTILSLCCFLVLLLFTINPQITLTATLNGLVVYASVLLPALLPFFVFTKLLTSMQGLNQFLAVFNPLTKFLFRTSHISSYIFFMSILSGYPVGAKVLLDVYEEGLVTKEEAKKIVTFTSNSGPMFIIGTVGVGMLLSKQAGYIMLLSHFLGSILNGVFYRFILPPSGFQKSILKPNPKNLNLVIENAMQHSITSLLFIGGYVAVFFALIELLTHYQVLSGVASFLQPLLQLLHIAPNVFEAILKGMFEITKGCFDVGQFMLPLKQSIVVCTGIISFGGLCVMLQAMRFLKLCHITSRFYLLQKGTHALFSMLIALGLARVFL